MERRLTVIKCMFWVLFAAIVARLGYWQIVRAPELGSQAQFQRLKVGVISHLRGQILFVDRFPMVTNQKRHLLSVAPQLFRPTFAQGTALTALLDSSRSAEILHKSQESGQTRVVVASGLTDDLRGQVDSLGLEGIEWESYPSREYPEGSMSAHLTGFTGRDVAGLPKGYFGLEGFYNRELVGRDGRVVEEHDARGRPIVIGGQSYIPAQNGRDLVTSIDRTIQFIAFEKLAAGMDRYQAQSGTVTVMEPTTGRILAMVSLPNYDGVSYHDYPTETYKNPIITEGYEPGSTFKTVVMSAALDDGKVVPDTVCGKECAGPVDISGYSIRTWNDEYHPSSTMSEIIQNSDNVGMVFVGSRLGKRKLLEYIKRFGFGSETGVDLEEETAVSMRPDSEWTEIDYATATFGQGIAVTPLQMVRAVGAIANGGRMVVPQVVDRVEGPGYTKQSPGGKVKQVVSARAAVQMTAMMVDSVEYNKAGWERPKEFKIAGKTGTAQVPIEGHYDTSKTIGSFVGFAPAEHPRFVMLVTLRETKTSPWGSRTAAPVWFEIAKEILRHYQVSPY